MTTIADVFGDKGFRMKVDGELTQNVNRALFDAVALSTAFADRAQMKKRKGKVVAEHDKLIQDEAFSPLVGRATADRRRMHGRVKLYTEALERAGVECSLPDLPDQ